MNKKGELTQNIMLIVFFAVIVGILIAFAWGGMILMPILQDSVGETTTILQQTASETQDEQIINASEVALYPVENINYQLEWITFALFSILLLTLLIMCFYVRAYPFLMFIWIFLIIALVFVSLFLTIGYQDLREGELGSIYKSWETSDFYLTYLPHIIFVIGIIGGVIMFVLSGNQPEQQGVYV